MNDAATDRNANRRAPAPASRSCCPNTSSKSSAIPARARNAAARRSAPSPRAWATACGRWRSSPPKSARPRAAPPAPAATASASAPGRVTNGGGETDLAVAFNEQVLLGRVRAGELKPGCTILLESMWRERPRPARSPPATSQVHDQLARRRLRRARNPDGAGVPQARRPMRGAARTCSRSACCAASTASTSSSPASRSRWPSARRTRASSRRTCSCWRPASTGPRSNLDLQILHPGRAA